MSALSADVFSSDRAGLLSCINAGLAFFSATLRYRPVGGRPFQGVDMRGLPFAIHELADTMMGAPPAAQILNETKPISIGNDLDRFPHKAKQASGDDLIGRAHAARSTWEWV